MLLSEQVRKIRNETVLVRDTGSYIQNSPCDWTTVTTKSITLTETKKILIKCEVYFYSSGVYYIGGGGRILLGSTPILSTGYLKVNASTSLFLEVFLELAAGTYDINFQISHVYEETGSNYIAVKNISIGIVDFSDTEAKNGDSGSVEIAAGTEASITSQTFTTPSARKLSVGTIKKYAAVIFVNGLVDGEAVSLMKNPGETDEADRINWKLFLNGSQESWTERRDDYQIEQPTYCEGAFGRFETIFDPSTEYTVDAKAYNGFTVAKTVRAYLAIIYSPWILLSSYHEPIEMDFPQGSTLYLVLEPLFKDPTKNVKLGKERVVSFGDATDYYSTASGTGILSWNYTFESVEVSNCVLLVSGYGGCVSIIAVDVR